MTSTSAFIIATLTVLVVLIAVFLCLTLYDVQRRSDSSDSPSESFIIPMEYRPACSSMWLGRGAGCRGLTSGVMPSIDTDAYGVSLCPGLFGVPP